MKKLLTIFFIVPFLSCSTEAEKTVDPKLVGEWVLIQTSGQIPDSEKTGLEMPFQESYFLKEDGSFSKIRHIEGEELMANGTYALSETGSTINGEEVMVFVELEHESINPLIANCTSTLTEHLYVASDRTLISTYETCDGMGLMYQKLN